MRLEIAFWCQTEDQRKHEPGDVIEVPDVEGRMLINDGAARLAPNDQASTPTPPPAAKGSKAST